MRRVLRASAVVRARVAAPRAVRAPRVAAAVTATVRSASSSASLASAARAAAAPHASSAFARAALMAGVSGVAAAAVGAHLVAASAAADTAAADSKSSAAGESAASSSSSAGAGGPGGVDPSSMTQDEWMAFITRESADLKAKAEGGDTAAMALYGMMLIRELQDPSGIEWFRRAAARGDANARSSLALLQIYGYPDDGADVPAEHRVPKDVDGAVRALQQLAAEGHADSMLALAMIMDEHTGAPGVIDATRSAHWRERAAEAGSVQARVMVAGSILNAQQKLPRDQMDEQQVRKAFLWLQEGAEAGDINAQALLGTVLSDSFERDTALMGRQLLEEAAKQGHPLAQFQLARLLEDGKCGLLKNPAQAAKLKLLASKQGYREQH